MTTAIYSQINTKINTILSSITKIKAIYAYPTNDITAYPAAVFYPSNFENRFETTGDNFKIYNYKLWIVINAEAKSIQNILSSVLPNVMDSVLDAFDDGWDFSTIGGHRVWNKISTGGISISQENQGIEVSAEIDLEIKMLTS
jgi:hypothetical protein